MPYDDQHQKLVDICFQLVGAAVDSATIQKASHEQRMEWVAKQLKECGFPTTPCGASWGVLQNE